MNAETSDQSTIKSGLRRESLIAVAALAIGFLIVPAAVYGVGVALLGAYSGGPHIGSFFGDFFRNLGSGSIRTWFLVASPYFAVLVLRAVFHRWRRPKSPEDFREPPAIADVPIPRSPAPAKTRAPNSAKEPRREPFVSP